MKVLHYMPNMRAEQGGVVKAVFDMCVLTAAEGLEVGLVTHDTDLVRDALEKARVDAPITLHPMDRPRSARLRLLDRPARRRLAAIIDAYDMLHLHAMWITSNPQVARLCRRARRPYVLTLHGMLDDWCMAQRRSKKLVYLATWGRRLIADAARIHCTAQAELDQAAPRIGPGRGVVIPLPMDLAPFTTPPGPGLAWAAFPQIDRSVPTVLFLSRLHYKKGPDRLLRASAELHRRGVPHQLVLAGVGDDAYTDALRDLAVTLGIADRTAFLGFVHGRTKVALLEAAAVTALPTSQENFGFVLFESLAAGTPVVTTRSVDTWPEMRDSGGAVLTDNTPQAFADAIADLLASPATLRQRGCLARQWALDHCRRDRVAGKYAALYRDCLEGVP
jgi:glycosyltransferase involved in cell wall biosynthesis